MTDDDSHSWSPLTLNQIRARAERMRAMARLIAAERCGLVNDVLGENLPDHLWQQGMTEAEAVMTLVSRQRDLEAGS